MKRILNVQMSIVFTLLLVAAPALVEAAEADDSEESEEFAQVDKKVGLGAKVGVNGSATAGLGGLGGLGGLSGVQVPHSPAIIFSLPVNESVRVEPQLTVDVFDDENSSASGGGGLAASVRSGWMIDLGAAVHNTWHPFDRTVGYAGVIAGYAQRELQIEDETANGEAEQGEASTRTVYGGPVIGAEYLIGEAFSVGAEASVDLRHSTTESDNDITALPGDHSGLDLNTRAVLVARLYLW